MTDVNLGGSLVDLIANEVEPRGIYKIQNYDLKIQKNLALIKVANELKAAMIQAANEGSETIDFKNNERLRAALEEFVRYFPEGANFIPEEGILHIDSLPDVQRFLDGKIREPITIIEYVMIILSRLISDQQSILETGRETLNNFIQSIKYWVRNQVSR